MIWLNHCYYILLFLYQLKHDNLLNMKYGYMLLLLLVTTKLHQPIIAVNLKCKFVRLHINFKWDSAVNYLSHLCCTLWRLASCIQYAFTSLLTQYAALQLICYLRTLISNRWFLKQEENHKCMQFYWHAMCCKSYPISAKLYRQKGVVLLQNRTRDVK